MSTTTGKYGTLTRDQFLIEEQKYERQVLRSYSQIKEQILAWGDFLADMHEQGNYQFPVNSICAHITNRMRIAGWTEGELIVIRKTLPNEYKDSSYDHSEEWSRCIHRDSVYGDFAQEARKTYTKEQLRSMSPAQLLEIVPRKISLNKEQTKRFNMEEDDMLEICEEKGVKLPQLQKLSADEPPEWMGGETEAYYAAGRVEARFHRIGDRVGRIKLLMKQFKPTEEVAANVRKYLDNYAPVIDGFDKMSQIWAKGFEDILIPVDDSKYSACASDWQKIGYDQIVNAGSHGSGVINAIQTGEWVFKESKDPNFDMVIIPLEREFTREQVGDKTARDLLCKARNMLLSHQMEKAIVEWSKKTILEEIKTTPEQFYKTIKH